MDEKFARGELKGEAKSPFVDEKHIDPDYFENREWNETSKMLYNKIESAVKQELTEEKANKMTLK